VTIRAIQRKISKDEYRISDHAVKRMIKRSIERSEIIEATMNGEIIEEYPEDKYSASCLIFGKTEKGRDLHIQLSLPPSIVIITAYDPDPVEWINCRIRR
jgi:hypothetical protein